ncbi:hypothetical protein SLEP1_g39366 [Rubroshorea leprosula]|uniref:Uncharacterized protein n=1 Tax=Rubroshorea leprosula TaxID=152421 RepID=A0AAV5KZZ2_9ROSI|nr:hypothetical protein SLEP1_g39366 [Rubroshorea leprosula]
MDEDVTQIQFEITGREIWEDTQGGVDIFVAEIRTSGTLVLLQELGITLK